MPRIHAYAQQLSSADRERRREEKGCQAPTHLEGHSCGDGERRPLVAWDRGMRYLYFAAMARALAAIKKSRELSPAPSSALALSNTPPSKSSPGPIHIVLILAGAGDLYTICTRACRTAKITATIHAVCLNEVAREHV